MQIRIEGCNNDNCWFWEDGKCAMPSYNVHPQTGTKTPETMAFDYDHINGRLVCVNCKEE